MQATDSPARVYLTGPMGVGKTTVGRALARRLGWAFLDLDDAIEEEAGCRIAEVFEREGEAAFRRREAEALRRTAARPHVVIATGGGALTQPGAMDWACAHGYVVFLEAPEDVLARRLASGIGRPLLLDAAGQPLREADLLARVRTVLAQRIGRYRQADLSLDATGSPGRVAARIADALAGSARH